MEGKKTALDIALSKNVILRIALGGMLLIYGIGKFQMGTAAFVDAMSGGFTDAIIPMALVKSFLTIVPTTEVVLGAALILGLFTKTAARLSALLFALFIVGLTSQGNPDLIIMMAANYIYIYAAFKLICCNHSPLSLDHLRCKGGECKL